MVKLGSLKTLLTPDALLPAWNVLKTLPGGGRMMGGFIGQLAPYTGTIRPELVVLEPGRSVVRMRDTPRVRNHLDSVHAIALMNLGEVATGTAVLASVPKGARAIITNLGMDYLKKARGLITAECRCERITTLERRQYEVTADLTNRDGVVVARAHATWLVGAAKR